MMNKLAKHLIAGLFTITACLTVGSVAAQVWSLSQPPTANPCLGANSSSGGTCACPQGYTAGTANWNGENCQTKGDAGVYDGCWNASTGICNTCGDGGTIYLMQYSCFGGSDGQVSVGGSSPGYPVSGSASCTSNSDCISWNNGATSGGYAQP